jgi:hypothetical protein
MQECEKYDHCHFFMNSMPAVPQISRLVQSYYCKGNYTKCARYVVGKRLGSHAIPDNLAPSDGHVADLLLRVALDC